MRENHKILNIYIYIYILLAWTWPTIVRLDQTQPSPHQLHLAYKDVHHAHLALRGKKWKQKKKGRRVYLEKWNAASVISDGQRWRWFQAAVRLLPSPFFSSFFSTLFLFLFLFFLIFSLLFFCSFSSFFSYFSPLFFFLSLSSSLFFYCSFSSLSSSPLSPFSLVFIGKTREKRRPTTPAQSMAQG
jgi:hypothetical protein